ncbi:recombination mediator RecR [Patescibacteria group bacterium]|nr:recombination mediator RecR [Patescibacteria group bacterium]
MSAKLPSSVQTLIDAFNRLPGIGSKMASRLTFHLLRQSDYDVNRFISALDGIRHGLRDCSRCGNIAEAELCAICQDSSRDNRQICVVEGPLDVIALEKTGAYQGVYHVLGGALSPIDGIGPDQLRIRLLQARLDELLEEDGEKSVELILATNPSLEGEATATYLQQLFDPLAAAGKVTVSRIARGLPMGSDLEYADPTTLLRALEGRKSLPPNS